MTVNFTTAKKEAKTIDAIAKRANKLFKSFGSKYSVMDAAMDITAVHANGCPLRLEELLKSDDLNFSHDIGGIRQHINRTTGKLEDLFAPRFAETKNKNLTAVAPEMKEMLEHILLAIDFPYNNRADLARDIRRLIAKAEGKKNATDATILSGTDSRSAEKN